MNILHTSDWHLGQSFFNQNRKNEHQAFLDWLLTIVQTHEIQVIIVAGDVFDTASPPSYARELYHSFVVSLQATGCALIVLGGNHDSVSVLNETRGLLQHLNTTVVAACTEDLSQQLIEVKDTTGQVAALVCAVPFLRPRDLISSEAGQSGDDKKARLGEAISAHYHALFEQACERRDALGLAIPIIATGHLTALGVSQSDSVRDIYIGTLEGFSADGFPPADYIALGHIHRPQVVAKREHIRYSGSPIPLSFDEVSTQKQVLIVSFQGNRRTAILPVPVPRFQPMAVLRGNLAEIEVQLAAYKGAKNVTWLCIEVTSEGYMTDLHQRIQSMVSSLPVEVLQLRRIRSAQAQAMGRECEESLTELTPHEVFERRLQALDNSLDPTLNTRLRQRFAEVVASLDEDKGE